MTSAALIGARTPRAHQQLILDRLKVALRHHRRVCICAPVASGKTFLAAWLIHKLTQQGGGRVVFTVPYLSLIDQTVESFAKDGITDVGVIQGGHKLTNPRAPVQVASIETLRRRILPKASLVIVDEAHRYAPIIREWMKAAPKTIFIGLTATPGRLGMDREYDDLVHGPSTADLIKAGVLSPFRVFAAAPPDLSRVKVKRGDYDKVGLAAVMTQGALVADVVRTWTAKAEGRPTIAFAVDRAHARKLQEDFADADVACAYIDGETPPADREAIKQRFHDGEIQVVVNVGCLVAGVDWDVRCVVLARPTKSPTRLVQMVGRGLRTAEGKADCLILDHSDTTLRLGLVTDIAFDKLLPESRNQVKTAQAEAGRQPLPRKCPSCSHVRPANVFACPQCGALPIQVVHGSLVEVAPQGPTPARKPLAPLVERQRWFSELLGLAMREDHSRSWVLSTFERKFDCQPIGLSEFRLPTSEEVEMFSRLSGKATRLIKMGRLG